MPKIGRSAVASALIASALTLAGCFDEEAAAPEAPVRAIKYMTVAESASAQQRRLAGVIEAGTTSNAAFQTSGQVVELAKKVGDGAKAGELLARLDPEPLRLRLASARSEMAQAQAGVSDAESKYRQQKQLFEKGYATRTNYESALANLRTNRGALGVAQSQLRIAQRDLEKTELRAPFDGVVAKRLVEPFEEVTSGAPVYMLQTEGENEVKVSLPETLVTEVSVGDPVTVIVSLLDDARMPGRIAEVAPLAEGVNAYPVSIRLEASPPGLRPGMSAQVVFEFRTGASEDVFAIPIAAVKSAPGEEGGDVFVFNDGKLEARRIRVANIRDNALLITGPIKAGDVIATAGVSLLYDGMPARLLDPDALK